MTKHARFEVAVGFQVYLKEDGVVIGAVRSVAPDHIVVYVEGAKDFVIPGPAVHSTHNGKVVLDPKKVNPDVLEAARHATDLETD